MTRTVKPAYIWYRASERIVGKPELIHYLNALPRTDLGQFRLGRLDKAASLALSAKSENRNQ